MNAENVRCIDITAYIQGYFAALLVNVEEGNLEAEENAFRAAINAAIEEYSKQPIFRAALTIVLEKKNRR